MFSSPPLRLNVRSYGADSGVDRHDFAQIVLPLSGMLSIDIAGHAGRLDPWRAAFIEPGERHSQMSDEPNSSLILDIDFAGVAPEVSDRLISRPFLALTPAANKLIDYMGLTLGKGGGVAPKVQNWVPLLLDALIDESPRPQSRLTALLGLIEAEPGLPWTAAMMAKRASISVSRLHALFRAELDTTPAAWLSELRMERVREWLARSNHSIAELAFRAGYSDQNALTRAMRRMTGLTPAAYRRQSREAGPKRQ